MKNKFIVFEGGEGCGKSTQVKKLVELYQEQEKYVYKARFPGGTKLGEIIRNSVLHSEEDINQIAELLLYKADEAHHIGIIKERLADGCNVISDRFCYSTIAYQGFGRGIDESIIHSLNKMTTQDIVIDILFIMNIPLEIGLERGRKASGKYDRIESLDIDFHKRVADGYKSLLGRNHPENLFNRYGYGLAKKVVEIDANRDIDTIFEEIRSHL